MKIFHVWIRHDSLYLTEVKKGATEFNQDENSMYVMGENLKDVTHRLHKLINWGPYNRIFWEESK